MRAIAAFGFAGILGALSTFSNAAWIAPAGYQRTGETFTGDAFAVAPDGKVAIAVANFAGNASIKVYTDAAAAQAATSPIQTFTSAGYKFWGDLTFTDNNTLLFSENGDRDTVYRGVVSSGATTALAPDGSVPAAGGVIQIGPTVYAVAATNPGTGALYSISGGSALAVLTGIGSGYLGGVAVDGSGNFLLTDSNDPTFSGNTGLLRRYSSSFSPLSSIDLAGGNGSGAYDVVVDDEGDLFVTTGSTLTQIPFGTTTAAQFGSSFGSFAFITNLDYTGTGFSSSLGTGELFVNAGFGDDGVILSVTPAIPEPAALSLVLVAATGFLRRRRAIESPGALR